ncbi:MAG: hypothetical protein CM15mP65_15900 [Crocinitomicaceae bacterium]|nr:MAG: hypothetical protein CM15mP65_15900 [Crocinitomicaceae bacterium]
MILLTKIALILKTQDLYLLILKRWNGLSKLFNAVWGSNLESSMTIVGSNGSIKVGGQYMNEIEY